MKSGTSPRGLAAYALHHSRAVYLIVAGTCVWGLISYFILPSGIYPNVRFPRIAVIAERGEDSVENMMVAVTRPIEESVNSVEGLRRIRSKTIRGATEISLDFLPGTNMDRALSQTRARTSAVMDRLSPPVDLTIEQQTPSVFPVISFNVMLDDASATGRIHDGADLMDWANLSLKPLIARLPDVFRVTVQGADTRQILVEADPASLAASGITLDELGTAIEEANAIEAAGIIDKNYKQFQILASGALMSPDDIANVAVTTKGGDTIRLGDVAHVTMGIADRTMVVTGNGKNSVVMSVFMRYGGKITTLSDNVKGTLEQLQPTLPAGVAIVPVYDQADLVRASFGGVRDAILIGVALTVVVLWAFLRSWRLTLVAGLSVPISILGTFAILGFLGESLNLMSLGGVAVAIGLIIDNAIVVVENIARRIHGGRVHGRTIVEATQEIMGALVGSSLTTVVVFVPLGLLEGVVGQFFRAFAIALASGILVSMVLSATLIPLLTAGPLGPQPGESTSRAWTERLAAAYEKRARRAVGRPILNAFLLVAIFGVGTAVVTQQATGFLPSMDEGAFVLDYTMPVGTSLAETDKNCQKIESILLDTPEVASMSRRTGAELGFFATDQFTGDFLVSLKPFDQRTKDAETVIEEVRERVNREVPQMDVEFVMVMQDTLNDLAGSPAPLEVKVFGRDYRTIQDIAGQVQASLESIAGLVDITSGVSFGAPEMTYRVDTAAASRVGLTAADAEQQLRTALWGEEVTEVRQGQRLVPVWLRFPDAFRRDPAWLPDLPLADAEGKSIPASSICRLSEAIAANELARENQQPVVAVDANIEGIDLGTAARRTREALAKISVPEGVRIEVAGQIESQSQAFGNLMEVIAIACGLVFLLLVVQFRSYRLPFIIFLTLPPSLIGALLALRLTGTALNISSFMGLVMLVGLVVKNGIFFIEYSAQLREEGVEPLSEALVQAGRVRLRPILMTSLAAIIAMLPLALNLGAGAELQRPLAIAVIGGLSASTLFTLLIVPVAHVLLGEPRQPHDLTAD